MRSAHWQQLARLIETARARGLGALSENELWELPGLYREALSDLSLLRTQQSAPHLVPQLEQLCNAAHALIYRGTVSRQGSGFLHYIFAEIPRAVRRRLHYILAAGAIMTLFAGIGWMHAELNPALAEGILPAQLLGSYHSSLKGAREQADLQLAAQIPQSERVGAWLYITINNIGVSVRAFLFGIAGGVITIIILAFNGYLLGVLGHLYFNVEPGIPVNLPLYFIAGIAPHGTIELPAICLAGGAGMLLGFSWLFPGQLPRGEALRAVVPDAGRIVLACALTLIVAGIIEGFLTPLLPPTGLSIESWYAFKIAIGVVVLCAWLAWLGLGGRNLRTANLAG